VIVLSWAATGNTSHLFLDASGSHLTVATRNIQCSPCFHLSKPTHLSLVGTGGNGDKDG
jgi:hypothetical protein